MSLPYINSTCHSPYVYKIDEFTENLLESVQAIGILTENNEYVRLALDKLQWVKEDLVRMDNGQQGWKLPKLVETLLYLDSEELLKV